MKRLSPSQARVFAAAMRRDLRALANIDPSFGPGRSLTSGSGGTPGLTASFTPATTAKVPTPSRVTSAAIQAAGKLLPRQKEKRITPEQTFDQSLHPSPDPTASSAIVPDNPPIKQQSVVTAARVQQYLLAKFNPIRGLTPQLLSTYLEQSDLGFLRMMALVWNKIKERDDNIPAVATKRELAPTDVGWEIVPTEDSDEARAHKLALEDFYDHISVTHALDQNARGGIALLTRQMMRAVGDKFSVHEIVWRPQPGRLTAEFCFIPVWFFENRTGQLRFLPYELALQGVPLDPAGWMIHVGDGLFQSTSIAYLIKQMALKYWANYAEKFGIPFLHAKTNAQYASTEWSQFLTALSTFSSDGSILTNLAAEITPIAVSGGASMPQPALVDRMDRAIARIWSGGDLSTMSRGSMGGESGSGGGSSRGSLPQMENEAALTKADCARLSETLQFYVDRWVIRYRFGEDAVPLAKFTLEPPRSVDADREIKVDQFLMSVGVPMAVHDLVERYGRSLPEAGEQLATAPAGGFARPSPFGGDGSVLPGLGNAAAGSGFRRFQVSAADLVARAQADALAPVRDRLSEIAGIEDLEKRKAGLLKLREDLPRLLKRVAGSPELTSALEKAMGSALVIGVTDQLSAHQMPRRTNGKAHAFAPH